MGDLTPEEMADRDAQRAAAIKKLNTTFLVDFFAAKDEQLWEAFKQCPLGDAEKLGGIHHAAKAMNSLRQEVQNVIDTGKMAQLALEEIENRPAQ